MYEKCKNITWDNLTKKFGINLLCRKNEGFIVY